MDNTVSQDIAFSEVCRFLAPSANKLVFEIFFYGQLVRSLQPESDFQNVPKQNMKILFVAKVKISQQKICDLENEKTRTDYGQAIKVVGALVIRWSLD